MKIQNYTTGLLLILLLSISSWAQWSQDTIIYSNQYIYKNSGINWQKRLPSSKIADFEFDEKGNIWFALSGNLLVTNSKGYPISFPYFFRSIGVGIPSAANEALRSIKCLKRDAAGNIWMGTGNGLFCFDGAVIHHIPTSPGMPFKEITEVTVAPDGNIWVCGKEVNIKFMKTELIKENSGIAMFDGEKWKSYTGGNSDIPCCKMKSVTFSEDGTVWMAGDKNTGICSLKNGKWTVYNKKTSTLSTNRFNTLKYNKYTKELMCGWSKGLISFNGKEWKEDPKYGKDSIRYIFIEDSRTVWIGTGSAGLSIYSDCMHQHFYNGDSPLLTNSISKIIARNGYKWFLQPDFPGYNNKRETFGGVCGLKFSFREMPSNWQFFNAYNSRLYLREPLSVAPVKKDDLVITHSKTIHLCNRTTTKKHVENSNKDKYYAFAISGTGEQFVITKKLGLCKLINGIPSAITPFNKKLFNSKISEMFIDKSGNIWMASLKRGVIKYSNGKITVLDKKNSGLPKNKVYTVLIDSKNRLWAGTSKGVCLLEGNKFRNFHRKNSELKHNRVFALTEDNNGNIYIGTKRGLAVYSNNQIKLLDKPGDTIINQLVSDKNGTIWIGTSYAGLCQYDGKEFINFLKDSTLQFARTQHLVMTENKDRLWAVVSSPKYNLPKFTSASRLEKNEEMLKEHEQKNMNESQKKVVARLKSSIRVLKRHTKYEQRLLDGIKALFMPTAYVSVDIK